MTRKEFYETLSDEVKEKIKACQSEEEMLKVLEQEQIELSPDMLEAVAGGAHAPCFEKWCQDHCRCD